MTKKSKDLRVGRPVVPESAQWVDIGDDLAAPDRSNLTVMFGEDVRVILTMRTVDAIDDVEDPGWYDAGSKLIIEEVSIRRASGVTADLFRDLPFIEMAAEAAGRVPRKMRRDRAGHDVSLVPLEALPAGERDAAVRAAAGQITRSRRILTPEFLSEVAEVYRGALASGRPTAVVREHFHTTAPTASRWVREARSAGLLAPAEPGKAGA